jgi:hypothetical protein
VLSKNTLLPKLFLVFHPLSWLAKSERGSGFQMIKGMACDATSLAFQWFSNGQRELQA